MTDLSYGPFQPFSVRATVTAIAPKDDDDHEPLCGNKRETTW